MREQEAEAAQEILPGHLSCDVAIVGYGPVAMVFSALIAQYGFKVIVLERWPERYKLPRAVHFDGEIMRTAFQRLGIAEQIEKISRAVVSSETVTPDGEVLESVAKVWSLITPYGLTSETGYIHRKVIYTFESSITAPWRDRRPLLMGDAAHTTPPYLGQGMCSGIRDAVNLAWKLAAVLNGQAEPTLLDTYEMERSPAVVGLIKLAFAIGERVQVTAPEQAQRRDQMLRAANTGIKTRRSPPFPRLGDGLARAAGAIDGHGLDGLPSIQGRVIANGSVNRLDDILRPGWTILSRHPLREGLFSARQKTVLSASSVQIAHISRGEGPHYIDLDADYDLWFRASGRKAFLVRPDAYIFGSVRTTEELPALVDTLAATLLAHGWHISEAFAQ